MTRRRDAVGMLRRLPAVFDLRDVEAFLGLARPYASVYCSRWTARELIRPLGPRAGVYFNLIVDPGGPSTRVREAVHKRIRLPVVAVGAYALHQHSWTTQRPHLVELAVPIRPTARTLPRMEGIEAVGRSRRWFHVILPLAHAGADGFALPPPEYALVDAIGARSGGGLWCPRVSDVEVPMDLEEHEFVSRIEQAARALGEDVVHAGTFAREVVAVA